ncbi:hypothetical protein V1278_003750 [Bradyrhizobium sp. AZCC 1577]
MSSGSIARRAAWVRGRIRRGGITLNPLPAPSLAILDSIDVRAPGALVFGGREGRATRVKSKRGRWTRPRPSRGTGPCTTPADGPGNPKLFGQVRKHGLTGVLGFGKRLKW